VLFSLMISAGITEILGIHALFGAFVFGAAMPKHGGFDKALKSKLESVAVLLLLPLFFAQSGLRTRMGLVNGTEQWLLLVVIVGIATVGKFGGSAIAARLSGIRWREANAIGVLMNTRGLMELIVLNVGLDLGVITPTMFTTLVLMALITTFATSPILKWVYPEREQLREAEGALLTRT
jgi:Kef-type K+ transport system membrane component KefB